MTSPGPSFFNLCKISRIFGLMALCQILVVLVFAHPYHAQWSWLGFWHHSLLMQWLALTSAATICRLNSWPQKSIPIGLTLMMSAVALVSFGLGAMIFVVDKNLGWSVFYQSNAIIFGLSCSFSTTVTVGAMIGVLFIQERLVDQSTALSRAKVEALQARIHPHFLFNTLNGIVSLISTQPQKAEDAALDFSDLLRANFQDQKIHSLAKEIELTKAYIRIEQMRLGDRLNVQWSIDQRILVNSCPVLLIQPLVENAILHGVSMIDGGGTVEINLEKIDQSIVVRVRNPVAQNNDPSHRQGSGHALGNIKERLVRHFGPSAFFSASIQNNVFSAILSWPANA